MIIELDSRNFFTLIIGFNGLNLKGQDRLLSEYSGRIMANRYLDWFKQAEADLKHARNALNSEDFEWSCFAAQQGAEKAIKAVFQKKGMEAWGHTLTTLIGHFVSFVSLPEDLVDYAKALDKHYIPT